MRFKKFYSIHEDMELKDLDGDFVKSALRLKAFTLKSQDLKTTKYKKEIQDIYNSTLTFADSDGFLFWARDKDGFSDNSLITASCSVHISLKIYEKIDSDPENSI